MSVELWRGISALLTMVLLGAGLLSGALSLLLGMPSLTRQGLGLVLLSGVCYVLFTVMNALVEMKGK